MSEQPTKEKRFYVWIEREYEVLASSAAEAEAIAKDRDHTVPSMPTIHVEQSP